MNWHRVDINEAFKLLDSRAGGLDAEEAASRLRQHGANVLEEKKQKPWWVMLLGQFKDVMILLLIAAALISGLVGDLKDTIVILIIVVLNAVVGFVQEYRADKAMQALKALSVQRAAVRRNHKVKKLNAQDLVPGDVVLLEAGDVVPADMRLIDVHALKVDESTLTGESNAVEKITATVDLDDAPLGDRLNMAYKGTVITNGRGAGVTVATGMKTEMGNIAQMLQEGETTTPLQKRLAQFGKRISIAALIVCAAIFVSGLLRGEDAAAMLLTAISVAVAAVPEALPAVVTMSLAFGARKLVKQNALIRKLPAVETLGSVTFICSDKTGTLTQNKMTVREVFRSTNPLPFNVADDDVLFAMALNHDARLENEKVTGDPTEVAFVLYAQQQNINVGDFLKRFPRVFELPFDSTRKMMTTVHQTENGLVAVTKGAVEAVLERCVDESQNARDESETMAGNGMRVLAFAMKQTDDAQLNESLESNLHFIGLVGIIDPPREEAAQAVAECKQAGIVPVMITGDHPATASAIATELGILDEQGKTVTGRELQRLGDSEFEKDIERIRVYARVSPEQKLRIVKTLQRKGHFVAMTGDGVNDAPALRRADIGVAMGITGTDVSKEAAAMVLLDDNFATIVKSVREGRRIFDNIRKFIRFVMSGNGGEIGTIFFAPLLGLPMPLLPIHILWVNLVTDGLPGLALANEPAEQDVMKRKPRPTNESVFARGLGVHILWVSLLITALCIGIQALSIENDNGQTMVFTTLAFCQLGHVLAIRSERFYFFQQGMFSNMFLLLSVVLTLLLQLAIIYWQPLNDVFSTKPLTLVELGLCVLAALVVFHAVEMEKFIRNKRSLHRTKVAS